LLLTIAIEFHFLNKNLSYYHPSAKLIHPLIRRPQNNSLNNSSVDYLSFEEAHLDDELFSPYFWIKTLCFYFSQIIVSSLSSNEQINVDPFLMIFNFGLNGNK
jgi:hypothetical protein